MKFTITRRSRNLGVGSTMQRWSRTAKPRLVIDEVRTPDFVGTLKDVMAEYEHIVRLYLGGNWRVEFFVGGVRVDKWEFLNASRALLTKDGAGRYMSDAEEVTAARW